MEDLQPHTALLLFLFLCSLLFIFNATYKKEKKAKKEQKLVRKEAADDDEDLLLADNFSFIYSLDPSLSVSAPLSSPLLLDSKRSISKSGIKP